MMMRKPKAIGKASHALSVHASAKSKTTVHKANLMAQLKINFQFITGAKVVLFCETAKKIEEIKSRLSRDNRLQKQTT